MKKITLAALSVFALTACNSESQETSPWDSYYTLANDTFAAIETLPLSDIADNASELVDLSKQLLPSVQATQSKCKEYLDAALAAADVMQTISLEAIEADYHADGKLPPMQSATCYHAKDLLVHPATVVVIAKTQKDSDATRDMLGHELEEVLAHFKEVKRDAGL